MPVPGSDSQTSNCAATGSPLALGGQRVGDTQVWLPVAAGGLGVLAGAAATVSYAAQYRLVDAARHLALAAALEAAVKNLPHAVRHSRRQAPMTLNINDRTMTSDRTPTPRASPPARSTSGK
jgi:hypothetical protein